jgi:hypothetical protein
MEKQRIEWRKEREEKGGGNPKVSPITDAFFVAV